MRTYDTPPMAFWILPSASSFLPSALSLASPVALPAASFTAPLACLAAPAIRSLFMAVISPLLSLSRDRFRPRGSCLPSLPGRVRRLLRRQPPAGLHGPSFLLGRSWRSAWCAGCSRARRFCCLLPHWAGTPCRDFSRPRVYRPSDPDRVEAVVGPAGPIGAAGAAADAWSGHLTWSCLSMTEPRRNPAGREQVPRAQGQLSLKPRVLEVAGASLAEFFAAGS
jgi:hypothetical protein